MKYRTDLGLIDNVKLLFERTTIANNGVIHTNEDLAQTNTKLSDSQAETDEMMLDHEERLILLEVGE